MEHVQSEGHSDEDGNGLVRKEEDDKLLDTEIDIQRNNNYSSWRDKISVTIEPCICAIFLAENLSYIAITNMIMDRTCQLQLHLNKSECSLLGNDTDEGHRVEALVQPYASLLLTGKSLISCIVPALMSLFLGPWSDVNGRKFLLLFPMLGLSMSLFMYAAFAYFSQLKPAYFLFASLPFSFSGGFINLVSSAYAYISDVSSAENRALRLGIVEASIFVGVLLGTVSSYRVYRIDSHFGYVIIFSIGALISLMAFLYTMFFVRESVLPTERSQNERGLFQIKFVKETFMTTFKKRESYGRTLICLSLVTMIVIIVVMEGRANLLYLFTRLRFGWDFQEFTTWCSVSIAIHFVGLLVGCVVFTKVVKIPDILLVLGSFLLNFVEYTFYGLIPPKPRNLMYWGPLIGMFSGVASPALRAVVSKLVPKEDVGKIFFFATSLESLFPLAFSPAYMALYNLTMETFPGAFLLLSAALYLLNFILGCIVYFLQRRLTSENDAQFDGIAD